MKTNLINKISFEDFKKISGITELGKISIDIKQLSKRNEIELVGTKQIDKSELISNGEGHLKFENYYQEVTIYVSGIELKCEGYIIADNIQNENLEQQEVNLENLNLFLVNFDIQYTEENLNEWWNEQYENLSQFNPVNIPNFNDMGTAWKEHTTDNYNDMIAKAQKEYDEYSKKIGV